ncbi:putative glucan endo-1,3-beta-D-glucosidase [Helianthus anomalus]
MRIYAPNSATLNALRDTGIELMMDVPNRDLQGLTDPSAARAWVRDNIQRYPNV